MERLKQKVASSSSRVIASLQQAAGGSFLPAGSAAPTTSGGQPGPGQAQQVAAVAELQPTSAGPPDTPALPEAAMSTAWLMAADATAHLTEEEREILLEVFKKEEQFQRDTIKQMTRAAQAPCEATTTTTTTTTSSLTDQHQATSIGNHEAYSSTTGQTPSPSKPSAAGIQSQTGGRRALSSAGSSPRPNSAVALASSATSSAAATPSQPRAPLAPLGQQPEQAASHQCRICRKVIGANEPVHLCSNCQQFICDDCASYSANEQHWMCSSCRRRALNPAIPAEALKELGLNQNSSAVRRMTLRLNQNELKIALNKSSSESTTSSNSSSGCSSMSSGQPTIGSHANRMAARQVRPTSAGTKQQVISRANPERQTPVSALAAVTSTEATLSAQSRQSAGEQTRLTASAQECALRQVSELQAAAKTKAFQSQSQPQPASCQPARHQQGPQTAPPANYLQQQINLEPVEAQSQRKSLGEPQPGGQPQWSPERLGAYKTMSGPVSSPGGSASPHRQRPAHQTLASPGADPRRQLPTSGTAASQQQAARRASVTVAEQVARSKSQKSSPQSARKMSSAAAHLGGSLGGAGGPQTTASTSPIRHRNSVIYQRPQQAPLLLDERRNSSSQQQPQLPVNANLMQIPPEQVHMRRLSDQSNLIRRSSIIADNLTDGVLIARNRSHSNIDSVSANYVYQTSTTTAIQQQQQQHQHHRMSTGGLSYAPQGLQYSASNINSSGMYQDGTLLNLPASQQHRRLSDQYDQQQRLNQLQLSSIVTSCAQKRRTSSDDLRSTSSSDIDDEQELAMMHHQQQQQQLQQSYQTGGQMIANTAMMAAANCNDVQNYGYQQQPAYGAGQDNYLAHQQPISIPSVSVSEFHVANQRRASMALQQQLQHHHHQLNGLVAGGQDNQQLIYQQDNQITPMQINVAIEQVIQQQQQREQLAPTTAGFLMAQQRRGSSGRVLPKVPGEQSRSLLDLPLEQAPGPGGGSGGPDSARNGPDNGYQMMLDLPSPTIRRASAPEGQNIKIVVDDMDASSFRAHSAAGKAGKRAGVSVGGLGAGGPGGLAGTGELLERVVLYRDDSLDLSNNNVGRGFGLQVMGGKMPPTPTGGASQIVAPAGQATKDEGAGWMKLHACITWVLPGGPADKVGLQAGDKIIEWDGKCLLDMSYEQVAEVIESSANIAELLIRPAQRLDPQPAGTHYVRSQRRLSQQTERDLRRFHEQQQQQQQPPIPIYQSGQQQLHEHHQQHQRTGTGRRLPKIPGQQQQPAPAAAAAHQSAIFPPEGFVPVRHASTGQLEHSGQFFVQSQHMNGYQNSNQNHLSAVHDHQSRSATELHAGTNGLSQQHLLYSHQQAAHSANTSALAINVWPNQQQQQQPLFPGDHNYNYHNGQYLQQPANSHHQLLSASGGLMPVGGLDEICGLIGLQVNVDEQMNQLEISVLSAINIDRNPSLDYIVRVRILPESTRFKACKTQPSSDMNWKETFIFQNFPTQQVQRMALEIGIWVHDEAPRLTTQIAQPICEALIPIQSARERNTDFWPLRPPPSSPQTRRKSLNDLIGTGPHQQPAMGLTSNELMGSRLSAGYQQTSMSNQWSVTNQHNQPGQPGQSNTSRLYEPKRSPLTSMSTNESPTRMGQHYARERSASNRNLPDTSKLQVQPRRASDEMTTSSSHRLMTRISPASSRRSISVMNVGDGFQRSRQGSQSGTLAKVAQMRRDSQVQLQQMQHQKQQQQMVHGPTGSGGASPTIKYNTPTSGSSRASDSQTPVMGMTPSGRRSSLIGIQSMTGYRSQKNSQSDATDHESPLNSIAGQKRSRESSLVASQQQIMLDQKQQQQQVQVDNKQQHSSRQQPGSGTNSGHPSCSSQSGSRRGSSTTTDPAMAQLQRRGSFAMQTLRKLKRTMSLTKGGQDSQSGSNQDSRRSSSSSNNSNSEAAEDLALSRSTKPDSESMGRLKLSFIMTKGQFEVEVICAQNLKFDTSQAIGIYVKMYLKAKNKSNKRKTRVVQPWDSPVFKQTIKYDGSLVDNKLLEVSVWVKQGGLRGQMPIGTTEIRLADLNLARLQTSWYNLRSIDSLCSSSIED